VPSFPGDPPLLGNLKLLECGNAQAFVSPKSLASTWLEFANWRTPSIASHSFMMSSFEQKLAAYIFKLSRHHDGVEIELLLEWSYKLKKSENELFTALQNLLSRGPLSEKSGRFFITH